ncbi:MAG: glucans biosynthesis glucosyltransferase MdoH [Xanthobacteraceae bacterium]|nr:glucans biosynthesis glucosyltransferase MdoH [Xanthobacteraceae bacterium]
MDTVTPRKLLVADTVQADWLPPESPEPMAKQVLWRWAGATPSPGTGPKTVLLRRVMVLGSTAALAVGAAYEMHQVLGVGGLTVLEAVIFGLFVLLFAWIALSFVSALVGLMTASADRLLANDPSQPASGLSSRTALLLPTYNEDAVRVISRVRAVWESLDQTGQGARFDFFILSDSTNPGTWILEEREFLRLREAMPGARIFYRHRRDNTGRKAGNVAEWVTRFGGAYDFMVVLDADSLMEGDTLVRLALAMERHPRVGLIQTVPLLLNGDTLFARVQQFANRSYGPLIARGLSWWHGAESNYWGHNAIIRVRAFAGSAGLPELRGRRPFGGHIMSHDFVEAGLLRRAGWGVHLATSLRGSYEECPPTPTEYAARDRRWCQGNLQHMAVLPARGLHLMSRLHLLTGIGCYITAPLWLLFLLVGILVSLQAQFIRPEYFPAGVTLFPQWPAQDPERAIWVFAGTMAMLIAPKLFGYFAMLRSRLDRLGMGGAARGWLSVLLETIISALLAPIMMFGQSKAVMEILLGRDSGWSAQRRTHAGTQFRELTRQYGLHTAFGAALAIAAYSVSGALLLWMLPVIFGLVLAIPIVALASMSGAGLRKWGLLLTPEERVPPSILLRANELARGSTEATQAYPMSLLADDPRLLDVHLRMLPAPAARSRGIDADLVLALAKIDVAETRAEAADLLTERELSAALRSADAIRRYLAKPS